MSDDEDEMNYCAKCGDPEFDKDGKPTHDYEPYDHDFEPDEEGITVQDVKDGLDILGKGLDVYGKYKKATTSTHPTSPPPTKPTYHQPDVELHSKVDDIKSSVEKGKKIERRRWIIGIIVGSVIAVIVAITL